jgi:hypothetical protein
MRNVESIKKQKDNMKKILLGICALGLLASCDPSKDSVGVPAPITESELASGFTYTQMDEYGSPSSTGNFFEFTAPRVVTIYRLNNSGGEVILSKGSSAGTFILKPTRGSDPSQTFYVRSREFNGSEVTISHNVTVDVPGELSLEMKIACSDSGTKTWTWDGSVHASGAVWGNIGYTPGEDWTSGYWWGCPAEELVGQLQHSNTGVATGEEDSRAFMVFSEEGSITTYDAGGNQIRKGAFEIKDYDNGNKTTVNDVPWKVGTLHTDAATILFPFKINGGGTTPTDFDIVKLTADQLQLVYADAGTASWSEATYWCFKSDTDLAGMLGGYDEAGKSWTWDTSITGAVWGNMGYSGGDGAAIGIDGGGAQWWGVTTSDEFNGQLQHTDTGTNIGDGDLDAYMTFAEGQITSYDASGKKIRGGAYTIDTSVASEWKVANLNTDAGSILWPFEINSGGGKPTTFEVVYLTGNKLTLVYPDGGDFGGLGGWGEASFWHFKAK